MACKASWTAGDVTTDQSGNVTPGRTVELGSIAEVQAAAPFRGDDEDTQQSFTASPPL